MLQKSIRFSLGFFLLMAVIYALHLLAIPSIMSEKDSFFFNFSYKFNIAITYIFTIGILLASQHLKNELGYIFLAGGIVKMGLFLYLINELNFELNKSNYLDFLVPYVACLLVEIFYVTKLLKNIKPPE